MKKRISIHIGQYHASNNPIVITTLVGSCVAACLYDPVHRVGGMNHILLPGKADLSKFDAPARYGINAMELLINRIMNLGGKRRFLKAKVFGGGHLLPAISRENGMGLKNAEFVLEFLRNESIKIVSQDVGGTVSRRIIFHADSGVVFMKRIKTHYMSRIVTEEQKVLRRIRKETETDFANVELFGR